MSDFPRAIYPRLCTPPAFPDGLVSWGESGVGQFRAHQNVGRVWTETYASIDLKTYNGRGLIAVLNQPRREGTLWTIQHQLYLLNYGNANGSPIVNGAGQTGATLNISNAGTGTPWLRKGDICQIAGSTLVRDIMADVNGGASSISISPPIFSGGSPAAGAAITVNAANIKFTAAIVAIDMPDAEANGIIPPGLTVTWREQGA
jgi:hypothetical protein